MRKDRHWFNSWAHLEPYLQVNYFSFAIKKIRLRVKICILIRNICLDSSFLKDELHLLKPAVIAKNSSRISIRKTRRLFVIFRNPLKNLLPSDKIPSGNYLVDKYKKVVFAPYILTCLLELSQSEFCHWIKWQNNSLLRTSSYKSN
jgi:hypothetical protein